MGSGGVEGFPLDGWISYISNYDIFFITDSPAPLKYV